MNERIKLAIGIVGAACIAGVLADSLLRATPWGINVLLWLVPVGLAGATLARLRGAERLPAAGRLAIPVVLFAALVAWRDSPTLRYLDIGAALLLAALITSGTRLGRIPVAGAVEMFKGAYRAIEGAVLGSGWLLSKDVRWREITPGAMSKHGTAIGRGMLIATPLILLFGALFASADDVFRNLVANAFNIHPEETSQHLLYAAVAAWLVGGFLRALLLPEWNEETSSATDEAKPLASGEPPRLLGITELAITLGSLTALFGLFVGIQFRYLFGGHPIVQNTPYRTYAEYAHKGFFELTAVAAIVLPLLLIADSVLRDRDMRSLRIFRTFAAILTGLVFVIMASAYQRMRIYQWAYGFTELRLYVIAFIAWLAAVFVWMQLTVLTGRRSRFTVGALALALTWIAALHVVNPDDWIVRANFDPNRIAVGSKVRVDVRYLAGLSGDAAGAFYDAMQEPGKFARLTDEEQSLVVSAFFRWGAQGDWRTWNWSRAGAHAVAVKWKLAALPARVAVTSGEPNRVQ